MELIMDTLNYFVRRQDLILDRTWEHFVLVLISMGIAIAIGVIIGIIISYLRRIAYPVIGVTQVIMTIPSIAMIAILLPFFAVGLPCGVATVSLYALLPIVRNTYTGIVEISPAILDVARGMGMKESRILWRIKLPLAAPVIMAGIRTAVVMGVGIGAIAAYIGVGGLGRFIFNGIQRVNPAMILTGAIFISILAVLADLLLGWLGKKLTVR